jgi:hypothetical protein
MERSERVMRHKEFLHYLAKAGTRQLHSLLKSASDSEFKTICELALNYIHGNLNSSEDLERRENFLRTLASRSIGIEKKREILNTSKIYRTVLQSFILSVL